MHIIVYIMLGGVMLGCKPAKSTLKSYDTGNGEAQVDVAQTPLPRDSFQKISSDLKQAAQDYLRSGSLQLAESSETAEPSYVDLAKDIVSTPSLAAGFADPNVGGALAQQYATAVTSPELSTATQTTTETPSSTGSTESSNHQGSKIAMWFGVGLFGAVVAGAFTKWAISRSHRPNPISSEAVSVPESANREYLASLAEANIKATLAMDKAFALYKTAEKKFKTMEAGDSKTKYKEKILAPLKKAYEEKLDETTKITEETRKITQPKFTASPAPKKRFTTEHIGILGALAASALPIIVGAATGGANLTEDPDQTDPESPLSPSDAPFPLALRKALFRTVACHWNAWAGNPCDP